MELRDKILSISSKESFEKTALEVYHYQAQHCSVYCNYIKFLNWKTPTCVEEIPFLPIEFFKSHQIISDEKETEIVFKSSGTGGQRSTHFVAESQLYIQSFSKAYETTIGRPKDQVILALLPNYTEQGESSLVYMVDHLIKETNNELSGFLLNSADEIVDRYSSAISSGKKVVLFGVSYALLDLAETNPDLSQATIIETGGMKGRRKEMTKEELHNTLKNGLNVPYVSSEYGMTELLSQGYSNKNGLFETPSWMKILIREVNDPFNYLEDGKTGGINVIDLANIYSCSFIATQDLGKITDDTFQILGRFDQSDIRGCNLLIQ
jgi:phenylacetate-coenzyme A ligase PaaK-like adenylate-forming protein